MNEIRHLTAVKAEQLRNQANRVSGVDSTSLCERPTLGYWVIHHWVCYPVCQHPIPETHTRHHANHANHASTKQDTCSTIIPCIKQHRVCLRGRHLVCFVIPWYWKLSMLPIKFDCLAVHTSACQGTFIKTLFLYILLLLVTPHIYRDAVKLWIWKKKQHSKIME